PPRVAISVSSRLARVSSPPLFPDLRFEFLSIRLAVDNEVEGVPCEAIDGGLRPHRIGEGRQPFVRSAVARADHRAVTITFGEDLRRVATLGGVHRVEAEVVDDEEIHE